MSASVLIILTAAPNAHPWLHTYIVKRTVNTSIVSGNTRCLVMKLISFFYIRHHFIQLNLSTWLSVVKNSKIRYRSPWISQQMEVTGKQNEYSGVAPYLLPSSVRLSAIAYECIASGVTFGPSPSSPVQISHIISKQGEVAALTVKVSSTFTQPPPAELLSNFGPTGSLLLASSINLISDKIIGI